MLCKCSVDERDEVSLSGWQRRRRRGEVENGLLSSHFLSLALSSSVMPPSWICQAVAGARFQGYVSTSGTEANDPLHRAEVHTRTGESSRCLGLARDWLSISSYSSSSCWQSVWAAGLASGPGGGLHSSSNDLLCLCLSLRLISPSITLPPLQDLANPLHCPSCRRLFYMLTHHAGCTCLAFVLCKQASN